MDEDLTQKQIDRIEYLLIEASRTFLGWRCGATLYSLYEVKDLLVEAARLLPDDPDKKESAAGRPDIVSSDYGC